MRLRADIQFTKQMSAEKYRNINSYTNENISQTVLKDSKDSEHILDGTKISQKLSRDLDGFTTFNI